MKKYLAMIMAAFMLLSILVGCGVEAQPTEGETTKAATTGAEQSTSEPAEVAGGEAEGGIFDNNYPDFTVDPEATDPVIENPIEIPQYRLSTKPADLNVKGLQYVLIYNPSIYEENNFFTVRSTGHLGWQLDTSMSRSDGLEEGETAVGTLDQGALNEVIPFDEVDLEGGRVTGFAKVYRKGDTRNFYCYGDDLLQSRVSRSFKCTYAGQYCNIWVYNNSMSTALSEKYGKTFDQSVYEQEVAIMGEPRYADIGGKINFLYYPMGPYYGGCFCGLDLYSSMELNATTAAYYGANTDIAVLHMNSTLAVQPSEEPFMTSTMAHEFQHLINFTDYFESLTTDYLTDTWFNEAMSGYIEECFFPGTKEQGHFISFHVSDRVKYGQSLYNFGIDPGEDSGVYGSVHLFSEYMARLGGEEVFLNYHNYWRNTYKTDITTYEAIAMSLPQQVAADLDNSIRYPMGVYFSNQYEELVSKMTLQFYLELLDKDDTDPAIYQKIVHEYLLYDQMTGTDIEGGGRILVALQDGTFTIPSNADTGLIYVGLDKDFNVITPLVYK